MVRKRVSNDDYVLAAQRYLDACFAAATPPHVNEFARLLGMTRRSLGRHFRAQAGLSVSAFFKNARVKHAQELLLFTSLSLEAIAHSAGFGTQNTFFRAFKHATGHTPTAFRLDGNPDRRPNC